MQKHDDTDIPETHNMDVKEPKHRKTFELIQRNDRQNAVTEGGAVSSHGAKQIFVKNSKTITDSNEISKTLDEKLHNLDEDNSISNSLKETVEENAVIGEETKKGRNRRVEERFASRRKRLRHACDMYYNASGLYRYLLTCILDLLLEL